MGLTKTVHKKTVRNERVCYLCQPAVKVTDTKYSNNWDRVDCINCLKRKKDVNCVRITTKMVKGHGKRN